MMKYTCTSELNEEQMKSISSWIKWKHNEMTGQYHHQCYYNHDYHHLQQQQPNHYYDHHR